MKKKGLTMDNMLSKVLRGFLSGPLNQLIVNLAGEDGEVWERQIKRFLRKETCWTNHNPYLRSIATGIIPATTGQRTFVQAKAMFPAHFDSNFENYGTDVPGKPAPKTKFEVFEMIQPGSFQDILDRFDICTRKLFLSQDQALACIENNPGLFFQQGWATFLPFGVKTGEGTSNEKEEFFVAIPRRVGAGLEVHLRRHSLDCVLSVEPGLLFVFPQP